MTMARRRVLYTTAQAVELLKPMSRTAFALMAKGAGILPAVEIVKGKCTYYWTKEHIALLRARKGG